MRCLKPLGVLAALSIGLCLTIPTAFAQQNTDARYPTPPSSGSVSSGSTYAPPNYDPRYAAPTAGGSGSSGSTYASPNFDLRYPAPNSAVNCLDPSNAGLDRCAHKSGSSQP
jgi:hypothetical protein